MIGKFNIVKWCNEGWYAYQGKGQHSDLYLWNDGSCTPYRDRPLGYVNREFILGKTENEAKVAVIKFLGKEDTMLSKVKPEDTITFRYYGGRHSGDAYSVKVTEITSKHISGIDLNGNKYKKFTKAEMVSVYIQPVTTSQAKEKAELVKLLRKFPGYAGTLVPEFNRKYAVEYVWSALDKNLVEVPVKVSGLAQIERTQTGTFTLTMIHPTTKKKLVIHFKNAEITANSATIWAGLTCGRLKTEVSNFFYGK